MKKLFLTLGLVSILASASCKEGTKVPQLVQTNLEKLFPGISKVDWDHEKDGSWEAEFKNNGIKTSVTFNLDGAWKEIEEEIGLAEFPQAAQSYYKQNYPGQKVKEIAKMTDNKGVITYELEVKGTDLIFDAQGNFIK